MALAQYSMPFLYASSPLFGTTLYCIALYGIICRGLRAGISAAAVSATPLRPPAAVSAAEAVWTAAIVSSPAPPHLSFPAISLPAVSVAAIADAVATAAAAP